MWGRVKECRCFMNVISVADEGLHVCGMHVCPHCLVPVSNMVEAITGGHIWQQDMYNHPLFGNDVVEICHDDKSKICDFYRRSGRNLLAFRWKVPGEDPSYFNQAEVDELVEFMDADQLERWRVDCLRPRASSSMQKKKKHAPSQAPFGASLRQKARKIKAKRAAAIEEQCPPAEIEISPGVYELE